MKRILLSTMILFLLGCAEDNPFKADPEVEWEGGGQHPHVEAVGTESGGMGTIQLSDVDPSRQGIQDAVWITFDKDMDDATFTASGFQMQETYPGTSTMTFENIDYDAQTRTVMLSGTFSDDTAYLLTIGAGALLDIVGLELDPNRNALYDGSPWDDDRFAFVAGTAVLTDITTPIVDNKAPNNGGKTELRPDIFVSFIDGPMDVSYLTLGNYSLVRTSDSASVPLQVVEATSTRIVARPVDSLDWGERYTVRLSSQIADSSGNMLDTNGDGYVWPDEPDLVWDFQMADDSTTSNMPPTLQQAFLMPGNQSVWISFEESLTGDYVEMDASTFIAGYIQVIDAQGSVPIDFRTVSDPSSVECVLQRAVQAPVTLYISASVADVNGNLFDGDNNGLGGTPGEDDWSGVL
jgi:hypothetical protein